MFFFEAFSVGKDGISGGSNFSLGSMSLFQQLTKTYFIDKVALYVPTKGICIE